MKLDPIEIPSTDPEVPGMSEPTVEQRLTETEKELAKSKVTINRLLEINLSAKAGL